MQVVQSLCGNPLSHPCVLCGNHFRKYSIFLCRSVLNAPSHTKLYELQCSNLRESRISRILENFFPISLLDLDLKAFSFHFSLSILSHFHFTFHFRSLSQGIFISLFILKMSEPDFYFTFHFSNFQYPLSQDTDM